MVPTRPPTEQPPPNDLPFPTVFVSYAHDSHDHKEHVRRFCDFLRAEAGVNARMDAYDDDGRRDWPQWALERLSEADFIIVIASPAYRSRADGLAPPTDGRGSQFEAAWLRNKITEDRRHWTRRILPVLLPGHTPNEIPQFLSPYSATYYQFDRFTMDEIAELMVALTGQPRHPPPPLKPFIGGPAVQVPAARTQTTHPAARHASPSRPHPFKGRRYRQLVGAAAAMMLFGVVSFVVVQEPSTIQERDAEAQASGQEPTTDPASSSTDFPPDLTTPQLLWPKRRVDITFDMAAKPPQRAFDVEGWRQARMAAGDFTVGCTPDGDERICQAPLSLVIIAHTGTFVGVAVANGDTPMDDPGLCVSSVSYGDGYIPFEQGKAYCVKTSDRLIAVSIIDIPPLSEAITVPLEIVVWNRP